MDTAPSTERGGHAKEAAHPGTHRALDEGGGGSGWGHRRQFDATNLVKRTNSSKMRAWHRGPRFASVGNWGKTSLQLLMHGPLHSFTVKTLSPRSTSSLSWPAFSPDSRQSVERPALCHHAAISNHPWSLHKSTRIFSSHDLPTA